MKVLACYNIKGGVGKTATAVNLAYLAAREGARILVWDMDPQGAASFYFRIKPKVKGGGERLLKDSGELDKRIKGSDYPGLDLIPADFSYRNLDLILEDAKKPTQRLRKLLRPLAEDYDYVFLDCAPSISLVSENIFRAAHALLVPTIPTTLSLRTLNQLMRFCADEGLDELKLMPFYSMVDRRKHLHRLIINTPSKALPGILKSHIPYASEVEQMGVKRAALHAYAPHCRPAKAYEALWEEVKAELAAL